jgi:hypothetical protein
VIPGSSPARLRLRAPSPIIIGVTGHRDLRDEDLPKLTALVDEFFEQVSTRYPDSDLLFVSGLADGADRLVAERAVALGHPFVALLPMAMEDYEVDFVTPESLAHFRTLLSQCMRVIELPWLSSEADRSEPASAARPKQYALLGDELVANSAIILALWNGQNTGLPGGTDTVVASARRGRAERAQSVVDVPTTFVYHIVTPRVSMPETFGEPFSHTSFAEAEHNACLRSLVQQNRWNRDAARLWNADTGPERQDTGRSVITRTFGIADALAISEQVVEQRAFLCVYLLASVATLIFGTYSSLLNDADYLLAIDAGITAAAFVAYAIAMSRNAPDRFQDYRALAEGLRVQAAWAEAGLRADVADHYTNRHRSELDWTDGDADDEPSGKLNWIRRTVRVARQLRDFGLAGQRDPRDRRERLLDVQVGWVQSQAAYFARAAGRKAKAARRCRVLWRAMALGALFTTIVLLLCVLIPPLRSFADGAAKGPFFFVIGMLSIGSALLQSYADKRAFGTLQKRYTAMHRTFDTAAKTIRGQIDGDFDDARAKHVVFELGKEALAENADWMIAMRDRPLEGVLNP